VRKGNPFDEFSKFEILDDKVIIESEEEITPRDSHLNYSLNSNWN
jgi:hypothetical protein